MNFISSIDAIASRLPAVVMVSGGILIIALAFRVKFAQAFKGAVMFGVGLIGIQAIVGVMAAAVFPAVNGFSQNTGLTFHTVDFGNYGMDLLVRGTPLYIFMIPLGMTVNLLLLHLHGIKTLNTDIGNYWVWGISAVVVHAVTHSILCAILAFIVNEIIVLLLADWSAPKLQKHYGMPGISLPHGNVIIWFPFAIAINWIIERIPFLRKMEGNPEKLKKKLGVFGDPVTVSFVMGTLLTLIGRKSVLQALLTGIIFTAFVVLCPKMVGAISEGLTSLSNAVRDFLKSRYKCDIYVGMDAAILVGNPENIAAGLLLFPVILFLALTLPGNSFLPMIDIAVTASFFMTASMPYLMGNIVRAGITGVVIFTIAIYVASVMAPIYTTAGEAAGIAVENGKMWSSLGAGSNYIALILGKLAKLL